MTVKLFSFNLWDLVKSLSVSIQNIKEFEKEMPRKCIIMKIDLLRQRNFQTLKMKLLQSHDLRLSNNVDARPPMQDNDNE